MPERKSEDEGGGGRNRGATGTQSTILFSLVMDGPVVTQVTKYGGGGGSGGGRFG